ncbi:MAG TPA: RidA family protein [Cellvibrionaceae bacterium]|nr:RidA family protein [Cellvibrionaceae bacterium]
MIKTVFLSALALLICACAPLQPKESIERKHYESGEADIGYSQVLRVGKVLYISGVVSTAPTLQQQLDEEYTFIRKILGDYGASTDAIVKETIYTLDMAALKQAIPARKKYFPNNLYPSASWVQVKALYDPAILLEIEVEAHLP